MRKGAEQGQLARAGEEVLTFTKNVKVGQPPDVSAQASPTDIEGKKKPAAHAGREAAASRKKSGGRG